MSRHLSSSESGCVREEHERLKDDIRHCDYCSSTLDEHRDCYQEAAKESGNRSKDCFH
ncbi:MAG: hypothetical protein PVH30_08465 [Desulfobacterales bacterium]